MKTYIILILNLAVTSVFAQPNCQAFLYLGDTLKHDACMKAMEIEPYYQFSKEFQEILDESLAIDSTFAYAYREKSVAYLKSGDFVTWKKLMDKAVLYDAKDNLGYRGWCRYQFFGDYAGAIADIERLEKLVPHEIGTSANGSYHLKVAKAICYKALGNSDKAIEIMEDHFQTEGYYLGLYDHLHLGVMYLEKGEFEKALASFENQAIENDNAENQYYAAMAKKALGKNSEYIAQLEKAKELYLSDTKMKDPYTMPMDKIYLEDIENELAK